MGTGVEAREEIVVAGEGCGVDLGQIMPVQRIFHHNQFPASRLDPVSKLCKDCLSASRFRPPKRVVEIVPMAFPVVRFDGLFEAVLVETEVDDFQLKHVEGGSQAKSPRCLAAPKVAPTEKGRHLAESLDVPTVLLGKARQAACGQRAELVGPYRQNDSLEPGIRTLTFVNGLEVLEGGVEVLGGIRESRATVPRNVVAVAVTNENRPVVVDTPDLRKGPPALELLQNHCKAENGQQSEEGAAEKRAIQNAK